MSIARDGDNLQNDDASVRISQRDGGYGFVPKGALSINVGITRGHDLHTAFVGIYGDPEGLLQLADLLTAIAKTDQSDLPDRNCPPHEGIHVHCDQLVNKKNDRVALTVGRMDRKSDGNLSWLDARQQVLLYEEGDAG